MVEYRASRIADSSESLRRLYDTLLEHRCIRNIQRTQFYLSNLCSNIDFTDARVLEVGGGSGMLSFYAACVGAKEVVCLEPESAGSTSGVSKTFADIRERLELRCRVELRSETFQQFESEQARFDVLILHNSVNHLDETACIALLKNKAAMADYIALFEKLSGIAASGSKLLVADCSRHNIFALLGLKNPFEPTIEWHKHQAPQTWVRLLKKVGFRDPMVRWTSFSRLHAPGRLLLANRVAAFFLNSHFYFTMCKI